MFAAFEYWGWLLLLWVVVLLSNCFVWLHFGFVCFLMPAGALCGCCIPFGYFGLWSFVVALVVCWIAVGCL